jgi:LAO/AO transport system kinase
MLSKNSSANPVSADPAKRILKGDVRAAATLMSWIEDGDPKAKAVLRKLYRHTDRAHVIGVTGAAGTGKSSLIDRMIAEYRRRNQTVGVLAIDPTSLFSGGALLGDRLRLREHFLDDKVFVRSFATRGATGGLSRAIREAIHVLDAMGKEAIFVETIGVGQDELEIAALAHTVVVVLIPEMGDEVQAMKAGLAEIADIFVVNKADLPRADVTLQQLNALLRDDDVSIIPASALRNEGIQSLVDSIKKHRATSLRNGNHQRKRLRLCREEVLALLRERFIGELEKRIEGAALDKQIKLIADRRMDPYSVLDKLVKKLGL